MGHLSPLEPGIAESLRSEGGLVFLNTVYGGGTYRYLELQSRHRPLLCIDIRDGNNLNIEWFRKGVKKQYHAASLEVALEMSGIREVYINHLVFARPLVEWAARIQALSSSYRLHLVVHDYFAICPSVNLLNDKGQYCGIPSETECDTCIRKLASSSEATEFSRLFAGKYKESCQEGILPWRQTWGGILRKMDTLIFPSKAASELLWKAYPELDPGRFRIVPHEIAPLEWKPKQNRNADELLEVCLIGEISDHKGAKILDELLEQVRASSIPIRFRVVGTFIYRWKHLNNPHLMVTGMFHPGKLGEVLGRHPVDVFLFPSIWPETFSYVTHEMMSTGLPIVATRIGAHGDALSGYPEACLLDSCKSKDFFGAIQSLQKKLKAPSDPVIGNEGQYRTLAAIHRLRWEWADSRLENALQSINHLEQRISRLEEKGTSVIKTANRKVRNLSKSIRKFWKNIRRWSRRVG